MVDHCNAEQLRLRAEVAYREGRADDAIWIVLEGLSLASKDRSVSDALLLEHLGRYLDASSSSWRHDFFEQSLAELQDEDSLSTKATVLATSGFALIRNGRTREGVHVLGEALALINTFDDSGIKAAVYTAMAEAALALAAPYESLRHIWRSRRQAIRADRHDLVTRSYFNEARASYLQTGRISDSLRIRRTGWLYVQNHKGAMREEAGTLYLSLIEDLIEGGYWDDALDLLHLKGHDSTIASLNDVEMRLVQCWFFTWMGVQNPDVPPLAELVQTSSPLHEAYLLNMALTSAAKLHDVTVVEELTARAIELSEGHLVSPSGLYVVDGLASVIRVQTEKEPLLLNGDFDPVTLLSIVEKVYRVARKFVPATVELTDGIISVARAEVAQMEGSEADSYWSEAIGAFRRTHARARLAEALYCRAVAARQISSDNNISRMLIEARSLTSEMPWLSMRDKIDQLLAGVRTTADHAGDDGLSGAGAILSARQRQVVELVASGKTDQEIAHELAVSPRTINSHMSQILMRLGARNRAEAAAWYQRAVSPRPGPDSLR